MIGQYLSNTNENAIVSIFQKKFELNKAPGVVLRLENIVFKDRNKSPQLLDIAVFIHGI